MKKKVFLVIGVTVFAVTSGVCWFTVGKSLHNEALSLLSRNIEALADGEVPTYDCPGGWTECVRIHHGGGESTGFWKE